MGQGDSQKTLAAKKQPSGMGGSPVGGETRASLLSDRGSVFFFFPFRLMLLPFLVSRHQHLASAASDNDFVTPEPRRTARRHPNTQHRVRKEKPKIVFSSDESSEEGMAGPGARPGKGRAGFDGVLRVDSLHLLLPPSGCLTPCTVWALFLQCGWACPICSLRSIVHHLCDSAFSRSSNSLNRAFSRDD